MVSFIDTDRATLTRFPEARGSIGLRTRIRELFDDAAQTRRNCRTQSTATDVRQLPISALLVGSRAIKSMHLRVGTSEEMLNGVADKWFPYMKGGEFRRWYGNQDYSLNWQR